MTFAWLLASFQNCHSGAGTMISAFGKFAAPALARMPEMWSPWKWLTRIVSMFFGSMPAACMLAARLPTVGGPLSPNPESISTRFLPVFTTRMLNWLMT